MNRNSEFRPEHDREMKVEQPTDTTAKIDDLEQRVVALEQLLLADRLGALDSRRLPEPR